MLTSLRSRSWVPRAVTLADQVLSSVSNVLVVVLVARAVSATQFGHFALGYAILTLTLGLSRACFGSRVSLAPDRETARRMTASLVAGVLAVSPVVALTVLALSTFATGGQAPYICAVIALATPVVCAQDVVRFGAAAGGRPWAALLSDGTWILVMLLPFVLSIDLEAPAAVALWGAAAVAALVVALVTFGERLQCRAGLRELRRREDIGWSLTFGAVAMSSAIVLVLLIVSRVLGPAAAGSLRGASTAMGPVNVLLAFTALGITPTLVRRRREHDPRFCASVGGVIVLFVLAWGVVLLLLPAGVGTALFGSSWSGIRTVLSWTVAEYVWVAIGTAAVLGLKVRQQAADLIRSRAVAAVTMLALAAAAAVSLRDLQAVAAGLAAGASVAAITSWYLLLHGGARTAEHRRHASGPAARLAEDTRCA
jgi:O-antigen/teichoic acid export membrane protein